MHKSIFNHRPALAAIAAVIACTPVAALAQEAAPQAAPTTAAPPAPAPAPKAAPAPQAPTPVLKLPVSVTTPTAPKPAPKATPAPTPLDKAVQQTPNETTPETKANAGAEEVAEAAAPARKTDGKAAPKARTSSTRSSVNAAPVGTTVGAVSETSGADLLPDSDPALSVPPTDTVGDDAALAGAATASDATAAPETPVEPAAADGGTPVWPWAVGGLAALGLAGFGMTMRRRRAAEEAYDADYYEDGYAAPEPVEPLGYAPAPSPESVPASVDPVPQPAPLAAVPAPAPVSVPASAPAAPPIAARAPLSTAPILATGAALEEKLKDKDEATEQAMLRAEVARMETQLREEAVAAGKPAPVFAESVGYHEARVDDGPTPENPFKTRKARLKRARQLDRMAAEATSSEGASVTAPSVTAPSVTAPVAPVAPATIAAAPDQRPALQPEQAPIAEVAAAKTDARVGATANTPAEAEQPPLDLGSLTKRLAAASQRPRPRALLQQTAAPHTTRTISFGSKPKLAH